MGLSEQRAELHHTHFRNNFVGLLPGWDREDRLVPERDVVLRAAVGEAAACGHLRSAVNAWSQHGSRALKQLLSDFDSRRDLRPKQTWERRRELLRVAESVIQAMPDHLGPRRKPKEARTLASAFWGACDEIGDFLSTLPALWDDYFEG